MMAEQAVSAAKNVPTGPNETAAIARSAMGLSLDQLLAHGTPEQKRHAVFLLMRSLWGDQLEQERGVYDSEDFLYAYVMPPGQRERLRFLEDPGLLERLQKAAREEETIPMRDVMEELRGLDA